MLKKVLNAQSWIGERIREFRKIQQISQEALAIKAGIPVVTLAKIEQGKIINPSFRVIWKISIALGISVNEFIGNQQPD